MYIVSYYIQTWHDAERILNIYSIYALHDGRLMDALYAHVRFDDRDARSQWVGKDKKISVACSRR